MHSPRDPLGLRFIYFEHAIYLLQHIYKLGYLKEVLHFKMSLPIFVTTHLVQSVTFKSQDNNKAKLPYALSLQYPESSSFCILS